MNKLPLIWKVALFSLLLFAIPAIHWQILTTHEAKLDQQLQQELKQEAGFYSELLNQLAQNSLSFREQFKQSQQQGFEVAKRNSPIAIDGYADEWFPYQKYQKSIRNFSQNASLTLVQDQHYLFGIYQVEDDSIRYQEQAYDLYQSDKILLKTANNIIQFIPSGSGALFAKKQGMQGLQKISAVYASWQETKKGYVLEFRMPNTLLGDSINTEIHDVDLEASNNSGNNKLQGIYSFTNFLDVAVNSHNQKTVFLDKQPASISLRLLNQVGQSIVESGELIADSQYSELAEFWLNAEELHQFKQSERNVRFSQINSRELFEAKDAFKVSNPSSLTSFVSVAVPLIYQNNPLGSLVISKSGLAVKLQHRQFFLQLTLVVLICWLILLALLVRAAKKNKRRIELLAEQTVQAFTDDGQIIQEIDFEQNYNDEISELANQVAFLSKNIKQHDDYQKNLMSRLNHELRTPIAIIRSSLDNLSLSNLDADDEALLESAHAGTTRLSSTLSRLSEANRLEKAITSGDKERFSINVMLENLLESYRLNWPEKHFSMQIRIKCVEIEGSRELFAQMLDKLVSNAVDFSDDSKSIELELLQTGIVLQLKVSNSGSTIKREDLKKVFNLLYSQRATKSDNLGLGLFIARKIALFHGAKIKAHNHKDLSGVCMALSWKKSRYWFTNGKG